MYYIYHIPGIKVGCTINYPERCIRQGYSSYELLEQHEDLMTASEREKQLNLEFGYPWADSQYYHKITEISIGARANPNRVPALKVGVNNSELHATTRISNVSKTWNDPNRLRAVAEASSKLIICPHCNKEGGASAMKSWHFDYCKNNPNKKQRGR